MQLRYFDVRRFPFVSAVSPRAEHPLETEGYFREWDIFLGEWDFVLRGDRHGLLLDLSRVSPVLTGAAILREVAPYLERRRHVIGPAMVAEARVVSCLAMRGVLTVMDRLVGEDLTHPRATFRSAEDADAWLVKALAAQALSPPSRRAAQAAPGFERRATLDRAR